MTDFISRGRTLAINLYAMHKRKGIPVPCTLLARLDALGVDIQALDSRFPG